MKTPSQHVGKSASALRTIGEVAEQLDVPQHVLRFWEGKFSQISPKKHRGRRYYRPDDIAVLQQIKELLYNQGYTVKGVQNLLSNQDTSLPGVLQPDLFLEENSQEEAVAVSALPQRRQAAVSAAKNAHKEQLQSILTTLKQSRELLRKHIQN